MPFPSLPLPSLSLSSVLLAQRLRGGGDSSEESSSAESCSEDLDDYEYWGRQEQKQKEAAEERELNELKLERERRLAAEQREQRRLEDEELPHSRVHVERFMGIDGGLVRDFEAASKLWREQASLKRRSEAIEREAKRVREEAERLKRVRRAAFLATDWSKLTGPDPPGGVW